jgi:hypothetical protein
VNALSKTKLCRTYMESGGDCPFGARCQFAHGEAELRTDAAAAAAVGGEVAAVRREVNASERDRVTCAD